ncbi:MULTISPECIES: DUF4214 domain-containing protein [Halomonas]|uniref:DUF4214 domain-containing protein n=1 Tax=Halomonas TaxID=2745 RepID=UPI000EC8AFA7|nr:MULTISPECIES: DUF4214 domain-containing protein [Halomonas]HCR97960.1 hypothetical protein [Halomonas sp.]
MALSDIQIQQLYTAYLGRPADQAGINYWQEANVSESELRANLANDNQPEYVELYGDRTREELVTAIYENMFGREPEEAGLEYWVSGDGASVPASELQQLFISAASEEDAAKFNARVEEDLGNVEPLPPQPGTDESIRLTQQADDLEGTDGVDTTFVAPVTQNETGSGQLANTFETGDVLDGGTDSNNTLRADVIATGTVNDVGGVAISAETNNIQNVFVRAQQPRDDSANNTTYQATIDAEKMAGVEQWWTDNSRADVRIEDIRTRPVDTIFGMESTDPEVGYEAYFNPLFMEGGQTSESQLVIQIAELTNGAVNTEAQLANISVNSLSFELGGEEITLSSDAMAAANTWQELETALVEALAEEGLSDLEVTLGENGQFLLFDSEGRAFSDQGGFTASATTNQQIDIRNSITQEIATQDEPTQTTLILDGAGNGSRGGDVNIAAMSGDRGVEVFNVEVDRSSHLKSMRSENNPNSVVDSFAAEQQLEEVYLTHVDGGAQGTFQLGARTVDALGVSTTIDDRLSISTEEDGAGNSGLHDVRVFDATGYSSEIKLAAELSIDVFDKYLADAIETEETVQFSYLLGDGGNNLSLTVDNEIASDPDFALEIVGGDSNDRVNLTDLAVKNSTSVDLEAGDQNTVEINTTTGANADAGGNFAASGATYSAAQTAFGEFTNINRLVIAGDNDTRQNIVNGNMTAIDGQEIVIATESEQQFTVQLDSVGNPVLDGDGNEVLVPVLDAAGNPVFEAADTDIVSARIDTELTITGKNQTLGSQNNNNDQFVGTVNVLNTRPIPGQNNLEVDLDNTARLNGTLTVEDFNIGTTAGGTSAVSVLDLTSSGRRNVDNLVQNAALAGVNTVNLDGTQNLDLHIASMAGGNSVVNGSELGGDLDLAMNASILNGAADVLTGTAATTDTLAIYGTDAQASVTGFESIQLGLAANNQFVGAVAIADRGFAGTFNASAVSGVEQYSIAGLSGAAELINLSGSEVINVAAAEADQDLTLIANDRANGNEITVNFAGDYSSELSVQDYRTVNLGLAAGDYDFDLDLETENGTNADTTYARTLNVTGGGFDGDDISTLDIDNLDTALTLVDLSGYVGNLVNAQWDSAEGTNATVVANAYNFRFDVAVGADRDNGVEGDATNFITRFDFSTDAAEQGVVWQIDGFQVFDQNDIGLSDQSIIDLRDLGVTSAADITISDAGDFWNNVLDAEGQQNYIEQGYAAADFAAGDTVVTSNDGLDFTILLNGVLNTDLVNENFAGIA